MVKRNYVGKQTRELQAKAEASIANAIAAANESLKPYKISILRRGQKIYIRGTFPTRRKDEATGGTKRYEVSCGEATLPNIIDTTKKAIELRQFLQLGKPDWWTLFPGLEDAPQPELLTMADIKRSFEESYWLNRRKSRKTLNTWEKSYTDIFKKIPDGEIFTEANLAEWLKRTEPNSKPREDLLRVCKCLANHAGIQINWKKYPCKYKPQKRFLPDDEWIEEIFSKMPKQIAWSFGVIATYGLRPSEMFSLTKECLEKFVNPGNIRRVLYVPDDTKTGEREVYPLHPEWVGKFKLLNIHQCESKSSKLEYKVSTLNKLFHKHDFDQPAYNLRHRYAIRASELGVPVEIAAKWMGHSVEEHCKTYQKWMGQKTHNKVFDKVLQRGAEISELEKLKLENQWLKEENKKLKAIIAMANILID